MPPISERAIPRKLFPDAYGPEAIDRNPIRPLGALSEYVLEQLPNDLMEVRNGLRPISDIEISADNLTNTASERINLFSGELPSIDDRKLRDVALLDLILLQTAIAQTEGGIVPSRLAVTVHGLAEKAGRIPWITYEDLVLVNPLSDDPRTLLAGQEGKVELDFYETHARIEEHFEAIIGNLQEAQALFRPRSRAGNANEAAAQRAANLLGNPKILPHRKAVIELVRDVGTRLHKPTFDSFNPYFFSTEDFKGPSGAFSAGIPVIEIILAGDRLPEDRVEYNTTFRNYFPRRGVISMDGATMDAAQGHSLITLYEATGRNNDLRQQLKAYDAFLQEFRGHHMKAVRNKAPETLSGERTGTAGTVNTEDFLLARSRHRYVR